MDDVMLTTLDNPYNPHTSFDEWYAWDTRAGYNTLSYLARIVRTSDDMSDAEQETAMDQGIDEIIKENILGIYVKIKPDDVPRVLGQSA